MPSHFRDAAGTKGILENQTLTQRTAVGWSFDPYRQLQVTRGENKYTKELACSSHLQLPDTCPGLLTAEPEVQGQGENSQSPPAPAAPRHRGHSHEHRGGSSPSIAWMVLLGDSLHNFTDGLALGLRPPTGAEVGGRALNQQGRESCQEGGRGERWSREQLPTFFKNSL